MVVTDVSTTMAEVIFIVDDIRLDSDEDFSEGG